MNIVFLITHASGSGKTIALLRKLLKPIEEKTGVKITVNQSNVFSFDNAPFEALCLIKAKGVKIDEEEMEEFSRKWTKSVQQFKRLLKHLATVKPHLTRETLLVYAARYNNIVNMEIVETKKIIGEDKKKGEIKFDRVTTKKLDKRRVVCTSECGCSYKEHMVVDTEDVVEKNVVADTALLERISEKRKELSTKEAFKQQLIEERDFCFKEECGCSYKEHMVVDTKDVVEKNVVADPALLARISEKRKELSTKEAFKQQLIEERDFCFKEAGHQNGIKSRKTLALN
ncbi:hypothetical protein niasHT_038438 [Heterodera trifolii]|uniref:Uncharacterized protein n=1 Tax=Heterodera trifolii TaxID=157864 RepID=A0ABD2I4S6_9BILA